MPSRGIACGANLRGLEDARVAVREQPARLAAMLDNVVPDEYPKIWRNKRRQDGGTGQRDSSESHAPDEDEGHCKEEIHGHAAQDSQCPTML